VGLGMPAVGLQPTCTVLLGRCSAAQAEQEQDQPMPDAGVDAASVDVAPLEAVATAGLLRLLLSSPQVRARRA
jgi:hypothetical protein